MKQVYTFFFAVIATALCFAQTPLKMSYQAVIRNSSDQLLTNQSVGMQISILQGSAVGTPVYVETQTPATNTNGLVTIEIGSGTPVTGTFEGIDWSTGIYFIKTETDPTGGASYTIIVTSQLLSVPYALHSKTVGTLTDSDAVNGSLITFDGTNWVAKSALNANSGGNQSQNNMQPSLALNYCIAIQGLFPSRNSAQPFIGEIQLFGFNFAPRGFASCSGQLLPISQNTALFSLIGTYYGGDGRTTFGLPDLRGRTPISYGTGPGLTLRAIGQKIGSETNTMTINQIPSHSHTIIYQ